MPIPADVSTLLVSGEQLIDFVPIDGFHSSAHSPFVGGPHMLVTNRRLILCSHSGLMKKKTNQVLAWPLDGFTERINASEGRALGSFQYLLTLFTQSQETVSAAFNRESDRDRYKGTVVEAIGPFLV